MKLPGVRAETCTAEEAGNHYIKHNPPRHPKHDMIEHLERFHPLIRADGGGKGHIFNRKT
jgi:hypothetical protein